MKKIILGLVALSMATTTLAENRYGVGLGIGVSDSVYKGADDESYPMPLLDINYGDLYIKGITLGYKLYQNDLMVTSIFVNPLAGFAVDGADLAKGYDNIDDRKFQTMAGVRVDSHPIFYGVRLGALAQFGKHGAEAKLGAFRPYSVTDRLILVPAVHVKGYTQDYTDYYFGVTAEERDKNRNIKEEYTADAGYSVGATLTADYKLNDRMALMMFVGVEKFSDEIADSPIVEDNTLFLVGAGAKYFF
ncbi:MipA/OmpV family protein [uncultured Cetobacterium sp.]|uniref:MipA/OmpV family protein n=1 Tax=uncultured Cetobacterium sp. TaxID=527638 RepID=UPI00262BB0F4|nr:MipA/OmpV family protein [uncultured Cetobacterium sp.]